MTVLHEALALKIDALLPLQARAPLLFVGQAERASFHALEQSLADGERSPGFPPEESYEGCMFARVLSRDARRGLLLIRFTRGLGLEQLPLHRHTRSNRRIWILSGRGDFHFVNPLTSAHQIAPVTRGTFVSFPKGLTHTFTTDPSSEMTVLAVHEPFQEFDDPEIIDYEASANALAGSAPVPVSLPLQIHLGSD